MLFGVVVWTFFPAVHNDFVSYDDADYVTANPHVRQGLTWDGVRWAFRSVVAGNWHPVTMLSHMLDCQIFGVNPWGHHLTSVVLHAINAVLVFLVLRRMTGATWRSLIVAALFALHPLRVESVAWVAERKDVLSTLFWLLTLWAYTRFAGETQNRSAAARFFYALALAFFFLGLMSKAMLVTAPCLLLLLDYWPLGRWKSSNARRLLIEKIPFFAGAIAISCVTFAIQKSAGAMEAMNFALPFVGRLENALVSYWRYLGKLFWPVNLAVFYPYPGGWPIAVVLLSGLLLLGISALAIAFRRRPYLLTGWFWFVGTLVPVIGLVQVGLQSIADRYTYFPLIGALVALIWGAHDLAKDSRWQTVTLSAVAAAAMIFCIALTRRQIQSWRDSETLFRHAVAVTKDNYQARYNLAFALYRKGRFEEASNYFQEVFRVAANSASAHNELGVALDKEGRLDEAVSQFEEAARLNPGYAEAHYNLGFALFRKGRVAEAIGQYQEALKARPDYADAHNNLGVALGREGRVDEAIGQFQQAVKLKPDSADIRYNLGNALFRKGQVDEAIGQFREAVRLRPDSAEAHNNLGVALSRQRRWDEAISQFHEALKLRPEYPEAFRNLGIALKGKEGSAKQ